jgi:hypothetical protein
LLAVFATLTIQIATIAITLKEGFERKKEGLQISHKGVAIVIWINLAETGFFILQVLYLLLFHAYLRLKNITTF